MTDFTDTIETTAEQVEDLQKDLEAHLEDVLGFGVTVEGTVESDEEYGDRLNAIVRLEPLERELERRFGADEVLVRDLSLEITPTIPQGEQESEIEAGIRGMAREEAEDVVAEEMDGDIE